MMAFRYSGLGYSAPHVKPQMGCDRDHSRTVMSSDRVKIGEWN
jgi:hypothetical protein